MHILDGEVMTVPSALEDGFQVWLARASDASTEVDV